MCSSNDTTFSNLSDTNETAHQPKNGWKTNMIISSVYNKIHSGLYNHKSHHSLRIKVPLFNFGAVYFFTYLGRLTISIVIKRKYTLTMMAMCRCLPTLLLCVGMTPAVYLLVPTYFLYCGLVKVLISPTYQTLPSIQTTTTCLIT